MTDKPDTRLLNFRPPESLLKAVAAMRVNQPSVWKVCADLSSKLTPVCAQFAPVLEECVGTPGERMTDDGGSLLRMTAEAERARRIKLAEEEERARLRVREEWEECRRDQLLPNREEAAPAVTAAKKETQADRVEVCLKECERRAFENKMTFDCSNMPGQKQQFLELLRRFDASFRNLADSTLKDYVKRARCKWSGGAKANPDATEFYRTLFPEAWRNEGGGVSRQARRA